MVIYASVFFLIFTCLAVIKNRSSRSARFLCAMMVSWFCAFLFLVFYLSRQNAYWSSVNKIFYIPPGVWNYLVLRIDMPENLLIRGMNLSVALFYYFTVRFALAFTGRNRDKKRIYLLLLIPAVLEILYFDPAAQLKLQEIFCGYSMASWSNYQMLNEVCSWIFRGQHVIYCLAGAWLLIYYYVRYPQVRFLKMYTLLNISCVVPLVVLFMALFFWLPQSLVRLTMKPGFWNYLIPSLNVGILSNSMFYVVFLVLYLLLIVLVLKFHTMEHYYQKDQINIETRMSTATMGINTLTHAMKNHIQGIRQEVDYLSEKYPQEQEIQSSAGFILDSCGICMQMLETANQQLKHKVLSMKLLPVDAAVDSVLDKWNKNSGRVPVVYQPEEKPGMAFLDEESMEEVLENLLKNAEEALRDTDGGQICIRLKKNKGWAVIEISDNGPGIAEEDREKIFIPFYSTKGSSNNWGIGLAYCHRVIKAHGGRIAVDSKVGEETTFSVSLPLI